MYQAYGGRDYHLFPFTTILSIFTIKKYNWWNNIFHT